MIENLYTMRFDSKECVSDNPQYTKLHNQWLMLADQLSQQLSPERTDILDNIMELRDQCQETLQSEMYAVGFKDGAALMLDLFNT